MRVLLLLCLALPALARRSRIVGGANADDGEWPWQLALLNSGSFSCGASVIRANWGVTAAHCVGSAPSVYSVIGGTNDRGCPGNECQRRTTTLAQRHPDYSGTGVNGYPNDIAVLSWDLAIDEVAGRVQYVPLASTTGQDGRNCFITGWGRLSGGGTLPTLLQEANIDVLTRDECLNYWNAIQVSDNHVCVFDKATQSRGACNGDSGGPLVCEIEGGWELTGLTSWGRTGCSTDYPSVYTRISSYKGWVDSITGA